MDNDAQIEYWNGQAGRTWVESQAWLDRMLAPITQELLQRAGVSAGERAVDVGCGCGETTLELARAGAAVWGIDISEPMLERARQRAAGLSNVAFGLADAATQRFTPDHQLVFSRFGVMFFADPAAAFANLRTALVPGGRLCFACWQAPRRNPWVAIAGSAVQPFLREPDQAPDPRAPGPFAFADPDYLRDVLDRGGFSNIEVDPFTPTLHLADSLDQGMAVLSQVGPLARVLSELDADVRERALSAARDALAGHVSEAGLELGGACWLVSAQSH